MTPISTLRSAITQPLKDLVTEAITEAMEQCGYLETCLNCRHFSEPGEVCSLYAMRPPARVIAFGCPKFEEGNDELVTTVAPTKNTTIPANSAAPKPRYAVGFDEMDDDIPF